MSFIVAPLYAGFASRIRLATFLPWVYGVIAISMVAFYFAVRGQREQPHRSQRRSMSGSARFNLLIISVFWSMMADIFSSTQAKRLFGFIAAGGTVGTIVGAGLHHVFRQDGRRQHAAADLSGTGSCITRAAGARAGEREAQIAPPATLQRSSTSSGQAPGRQPLRRLRAAVPSRAIC